MSDPGDVGAVIATANATAAAAAAGQPTASVCASTAATSLVPGPPTGCVIDPDYYTAMGVSHRLPSGGSTHELAARLLQLLVGFVRDISTVYEVMGTFYRYMDNKQRWGEHKIVQVRVCVCVG